MLMAGKARECCKLPSGVWGKAAADIDFGVFLEGNLGWSLNQGARVLGALDQGGEWNQYHPCYIMLHG